MEKKYCLGIGLNRFDARAVLLREDGKVIASIEKKRGAISANEIIEDLLGLYEAILAKAKKYRDQIKGAGLALGGIIDSKKGFVYWPEDSGPAYVHVSLPLKEFLEKKYGHKVTVINDANACVWSEYLLNFSKFKHILYMFSGVGCGIIADGKLYGGRNGRAGEVFLNSRKSMRSPLGDFSFLRQWPIDISMVNRAKGLISLGRRTSLIKRISPTGELSLDAIISEAKKKDKLAREVVKEAAFTLGVKIAFLVNLLNPEVIIIGGGMEEAGDLFLDECINAVKDFSFSEMRKNLKITLSCLGKDAVSLGAAYISLKEKSLH